MNTITQSHSGEPKYLPALQNDMLSFKFETLGVRVVMIDGEPWFVSPDVCAALGLHRTASRKLDSEEKGVHSVHTPGGEQELAIISESGLYTLILRSRHAMTPGTLPHRFRKWVSREVLPTIRRTGGYGTQELPPINVRKLMLMGAKEPEVQLSPALEAAIEKKAWLMAHEAYEISVEHLRRRVAWQSEIGWPRRIDRRKAFATIRNTDLGSALTHLWHEKVDIVDHSLRQKVGFVMEISDVLKILDEAMPEAGNGRMAS